MARPRKGSSSSRARQCMHVKGAVAELTASASKGTSGSSDTVNESRLEKGGDRSEAAGDEAAEPGPSKCRGLGNSPLPGVAAGLACTQAPSDRRRLACGWNAGGGSGTLEARH